MYPKIRSVLAAAALAVLMAAPAGAGVVYEIETTDHTSSSPRSVTQQVEIEGENLSMEIPADRREKGGVAIYRGDRREMVVVDHGEKAYFVIDKQAIAGIAGQVDTAMSQAMEAIKDLPEAQRAQVEEMMKQQMPGRVPDVPQSSLRRTGERADHAGYPCVKYEELRKGTKVRELWVTDWDNVEGGEETAKAFESMARFFSEAMEPLRKMGGLGGAFDTSTFAHLTEIDGFPVVTREYSDDGTLESESTLRSATRRTLDPDDFEPPAGYKRRSMMPSG